MNRLVLTFISVFAVVSVFAQESAVSAKPPRPQIGPPVERSMRRAGTSHIDLRSLPQVPIEKRERPEREEPEIEHTLLPGGPAEVAPAPFIPVPTAPAPPPIQNFDGLDFANFGGGHPPDTNGDVGPNHYIETINTSIGIYNKTGTRLAAFGFNAFMSQGNFGNLCDTNNFGDPVVVYDSFEDRWIITDFAFEFNPSTGVVINPPGQFQCFAVSINGDPVSGGWNYYSIHVEGGLGDYPKFGVWPDALYMTANMFQYDPNAGYIGPRMWAFNKAQLYAGASSVQVVTIDGPANDFTILPSNARLQTGTPPPGTPNYFVSTELFTNALAVYKFHVDWNRISLSTFTGPDTPFAAAPFPTSDVSSAPTPGNNADTLEFRNMVQNQYTNISGAESLWTTHTVPRLNNGSAAPRWYQANVTSGTVAANLVQSATWDPDNANTFWRFMPSLAVDRLGDMALGYTKTNATTNPQIKYAGRLAADPVNTFSQTEQTLINGTGAQVGDCGGTCQRWGDYSAMALDPNGCTFWYTNMYYAVNGLDYLTRIGSFQFTGCTAVANNGTLSGTVTSTAGGGALAGAVVKLGSRTTTTNGAGVYSFSPLPAGTYPVLTVTFPGFVTGSATSIVVSDNTTTTRNFALTPAATSGCPVDTTTADFETGILSNVDVTTLVNNVSLVSTATIDQQNTSLNSGGFTVTTSQWMGQTFTPSISGVVPKLDINLFCGACSGSNPPVTVEIRSTSGGLPTGTVASTTTIAGFSSGSAVFYTATFNAPAFLSAGTVYAIVVRLVTARTVGSYAVTDNSFNPYAGGNVVFSTNAGGSWGALAGDDLGFKIYVNTGFSPSGTLISATKDANPLAGTTPRWSTLSWTASVPGGTSLKFQAAGSNSPSGPFNFVGPDGTATSFFTTSPASIVQFTNNRYLQYKAILATTDPTVTPLLGDVTVCYSSCPSVPAAPSITTTPSIPVGAIAATASVVPNAGSTYTWSISGGATITGGQGTSTITYNAAPPGTRMTLSVVETTSTGCISQPGSRAQMVDFLDVPPTHPFHTFVIKIAIAGITAGCGNGNFCPNNSVTRAQMAVFLLTGKYGFGYTPPGALGIFNDVPVGSFAANFIEELFNEGITGGCSSNPPKYCPGDPVTRAQMAVFLLIAKHGIGYTPPPAAGIFNDVPPGAFARNFIEELFNEGITSGCSSNPPLFCPTNSTSRGQMSVFLSTTFALP